MFESIKNYLIRRKEIERAAKENLTVEEYRLWKKSGRWYDLDFQEDVMRFIW